MTDDKSKDFLDEQVKKAKQSWATYKSKQEEKARLLLEKEKLEEEIWFQGMRYMMETFDRVYQVFYEHGVFYYPIELTKNALKIEEGILGEQHQLTEDLYISLYLTRYFHGQISVDSVKLCGFFAITYHKHRYGEPPVDLEFKITPRRTYIISCNKFDVDDETEFEIPFGDKKLEEILAVFLSTVPIKKLPD